jgi:hypothetical protein
VDAGLSADPALATAPGEPVAVPYPTGDPRRVSLADVVGRVAALTAALARQYAAASEHADGALREALTALASRQEALTAEVAPLARALGVAPCVPSAPAVEPNAWGPVFREAFEGERALEALGRDLAVLGGDPRLGAVGARLTAAAARDRAEVRRLYLRYS